MRTLANLSGKTALVPEAQLSILAVDASTTFVHCLHAGGGIAGLSPIKFDGPFAGGFGRTGHYKATLGFDGADPLATIKARLPLYTRGTATLRVDVGSETFYPHVGRVRSIERDGFDPNRITLTIYDRFIDDNPMIPGEAIVDSYATVHPEEINADAGYPWYYGDESLRPFYMTAVDCHILSLIGPRNVSSESHVQSLWFNSDFSKEDEAAEQNLILTDKAWAQQSGGNNLAAGGEPFGILNAGPLDARFWKFTDGTLQWRSTDISSRDSIVN